MKTSIRTALLLAPLCCGPGMARAGYSFSLDPAGGVDLGHLRAGQTFDLLVNVAGIGPGAPISYFHLTESLGGTLFQFLGIAAGESIPDGERMTSNASPSRFEVDYRGSTPITAPGTLAVVTLIAARAGFGTLTLASPSYLGPLTSEPVDYGGMVRDFAIAPAAVPGPSSLVPVLVAAGLGGLARLRPPGGRLDSRPIAT